MIKKIQGLISALALMFVLGPQLALAQTVNCLSGIPKFLCIPTDTNITDSYDIIAWALILFEYILAIAGILAVGVVVWSAILFLTSGADEKRRENARKWLTGGVIGIIVAVISFTIIQIVSSFFVIS